MTRKEEGKGHYVSENRSIGGRVAEHWYREEEKSWQSEGVEHSLSYGEKEVLSDRWGWSRGKKAREIHLAQGGGNHVRAGSQRGGGGYRESLVYEGGKKKGQT